MVERRRIRLEHLHKAHADLLENAPSINKQTASTQLGLGIIQVFLGDDWLANYVLPGASNQNIFRIDDDDALEAERARFRVTDLAEVLFNLQGVPGFYECVERMRLGDIEGTFAELDLGRMLFIHRVLFRYVIPTGKRGSDYDVEITYPTNVIACADAKCKIEGREFRAKTIENTLEDARKQLPKDRPGIVFVKVPQEWMQLPDFEFNAKEIAVAFFRQTQRIVSVKYYVAPITFVDGFIVHRHGFKEYSNPKTRFGEMQNWDVFNKFDVPPELNGMPAHWQRIILFPDGK